MVGFGFNKILQLTGDSQVSGAIKGLRVGGKVDAIGINPVVAMWGSLFIRADRRIGR
jgi:hypothetical protein